MCHKLWNVSGLTHPLRSSQVDERELSDGLHAAASVGELDHERTDEVRATALGVHLRGGGGASTWTPREYLHHLSRVGGCQYFRPFDENQSRGTMFYTQAIQTRMNIIMVSVLYSCILACQSDFQSGGFLFHIVFFFSLLLLLSLGLFFQKIFQPIAIELEHLNFNCEFHLSRSAEEDRTI